MILFSEVHIIIKIIFLLFTIVSSGITTAFSQVDSLNENNSDKISHRVILIGDAGESENDDDPVLSALKDKASEVDSTLVIFLGDNVYPDGLVSEVDPDREQSVRYLNRQLNTVLDSKAQGLFIPGNHDWDGNDMIGWKQITRQADYVSSFSDKGIRFLPLNGYPGPEVFDFGYFIRIVILDTEWWLRESGHRPEPRNSQCTHCEEQSVINALDSVLNISSEKIVILAAHHPLRTHGPHGGYFSWIDHIFPLTNLNEFLWIPLPVIGSLYPLIRGMGVSAQDLSSSEYSNMKQQIENVIIRYPNVVVASGHEHALQVLEGPAGNIYLVSGAGVWGDPTISLTEGDDTIFSSKYDGFMILDYYETGKVELSVIRVVNESGERKEVYSMWIKMELN